MTDDNTHASVQFMTNWIIDHVHCGDRLIDAASELDSQITSVEDDCEACRRALRGAAHVLLLTVVDVFWSDDLIDDWNASLLAQHPPLQRAVHAAESMAAYGLEVDDHAGARLEWLWVTSHVERLTTAHLAAAAAFQLRHVRAIADESSGALVMAAELHSAARVLADRTDNLITGAYSPARTAE